jgi:hypothetical protein
MRTKAKALPFSFSLLSAFSPSLPRRDETRREKARREGQEARPSRKEKEKESVLFSFSSPLTCCCCCLAVERLLGGVAGSSAAVAAFRVFFQVVDSEKRVSTSFREWKREYSRARERERERKRAREREARRTRRWSHPSRCSLLFFAKVATSTALQSSSCFLPSRRNTLTDCGSCDAALPRARSNQIRCGGREVGGCRCCWATRPHHGARSSLPSRQASLRPVSSCLGPESGSREDRNTSRMCERGRARHRERSRSERGGVRLSPNETFL